MKKIISLFVMIILFVGMMHAQQKSTVTVKELNSDIEKYVEKNYKDYKITEAYKYDLVYEVTVKKESAGETLVFDRNEKFLYKKTDADKGKTALQTRTTMSLKDVPGGIEKYVKNMEGYKITEAFWYEEVFTTKIMKGTEAVALVFDKDGKFIMVKKAPPAAPPAAAKADSAAAKPAPPPAPAAMPDTTKK